jgi:hypothetical protein
MQFLRAASSWPAGKCGGRQEGLPSALPNLNQVGGTHYLRFRVTRPPAATEVLHYC